MATPTTGIIRWASVRGLCQSLSPDVLPPDLVPQINDVELVEGAIGRRRPNIQTVSLTSGPTGTIRYLYRFITSAAVEEDWAFSLALEAHRRVAGTWSSVVLLDTATAGTHCATLAGFLFLAYNSAVNRLHLWDGTAVRRVGIGAITAPTVANTGAGAYAATARYYRTSQRIKSGSTIVAESELSTAVSFTPSGAGTAARVTKSTTVDSATHWVVWGLIGTSGDTYDLYHELAEIVVGTTTYDDSTNPSAYTADGPPQLGLNIPPPSAKFLLSDGNRLLMAGAYETTAATGETTPKTSRVWFTRVTGSSDRGDAETIPNTTDVKNWVDCNDGDGDELVGLAGPISGVIFALKSRSIYTLTPTGNDETPYRVDRISSQVGCRAVNAALSQHTIFTAEDTIGQPAVYFPDIEKLYRISGAAGIEQVNADLTPLIYSQTKCSTFTPTCGVFWQDRQQLLYVNQGVSVVGGETVVALWVYTPRFAARDSKGLWRGGWTLYGIRAVAVTDLQAIHAMLITGGLLAADAPWFGGWTGVGPAIFPFLGAFVPASNGANDPGGAIAASVVSPPFLPAQQGARNVTLDAPSIDAACTTSATPTVAYLGGYGAETRSATAPALTAVGSETRKTVKVEGLELADAAIVQVRYTWDTDQYSSDNPATTPVEMTSAIRVPYRIQEMAGNS